MISNIYLSIGFITNPIWNLAMHVLSSTVVSSKSFAWSSVLLFCSSLLKLKGELLQKSGQSRILLFSYLVSSTVLILMGLETSRRRNRSHNSFSYRTIFLFYCRKFYSIKSCTFIKFMKQKYHWKIGVGLRHTSLENRNGTKKSNGFRGSNTISCTRVLAIIDAALLLSWYYIMVSRS